MAALASRHAALRHGLEVLGEELQDRDAHQTRFLLVVPARYSMTRTDAGDGARKTALIAETENRPGALHELLGVFAERGLDLT